jgi:hypothetical protein
MKATFIYHKGNQRMEKFYKNLLNEPDFCRICEDCYNCRGDWTYKDDVKAVVLDAVDEDEFIEDASDYIPELPNGDVAIAQLHEDLLWELPNILAEKNYKLLIVPSETPSDLSIAMRNSLKELCEKNNMDFENPKPFCALKKRHKRKVLNEFINYFKIGFPQVEIKSEDRHKIDDINVIISAPCGETYYISKRIKGKIINEIKDEIANAHHNYPCLGSMEYDKELEDTMLHEAGYIAMDAVKKGLLPYKCKNKFCGRCGIFGQSSLQ